MASPLQIERGLKPFVHPRDSFSILIVSHAPPCGKGSQVMRQSSAKRLISATLIALAAGLFVYVAQPQKRIKADLRSDAKGLILSLEYSARMIES
jgi:hypothetical protein